MFLILGGGDLVELKKKILYYSRIFLGCLWDFIIGMVDLLERNGCFVYQIK